MARHSVLSDLPYWFLRVKRAAETLPGCRAEVYATPPGPCLIASGRPRLAGPDLSCTSIQPFIQRDLSAPVVYYSLVQDFEGTRTLVNAPARVRDSVAFTPILLERERTYGMSWFSKRWFSHPGKR